MLRTLLALFCALTLSATVTTDYAEAKKSFGGGKSFGKLFSTPKKTQPALAPKASSQSNTANKTAAAGTAKPRSGFGGLMGGLLAGGLLGALFMGGAFDGIQFMDILIIALIAFVAFKLFARMRQAQPRPQYAGAAAGAGHEMPQNAAADPVQPQSPMAREATGFEPTPLMSGRLAEAELALPDWFNREAFVEGAKNHFSALQAAWNRNDLEEIRSYCSAELFAELEKERRELGEGELRNDVVSIMGELVGFTSDAAEARLSINFYGWMREEPEAATEEFNEIWHLTRDLTRPDADWYIVGIEQPGQGF